MLAMLVSIKPLGAIHVHAEENDGTITFVEYTEDYYTSDMEGEYFIFVGFAGDKAYVMGNVTNADGSREAVEIPVKANGAIDVSSAIAEIFSFQFSVPDVGGYTFSPDDKYMSIKDGKIITYDKNQAGEDGVPNPIMFIIDDVYQNAGCFYRWPTTNKEYIVFDADTLTFKVSNTPSDSIVQYKQVCPHTNMEHIPGAPATCTQQGALEYWYCDECYGYYCNGDFEVPMQGEDGGYVTDEMFTLPALGHRYNSEGVCENCAMNRPIYKPVTSLDQFDQLSENASYIIVFKDGNKAYAAFVPINAQTPYDVDDNNDGIADILTIDTNANEVPDCIEEYFIEYGYGDPFEDSIYGDQNENGVLDAEDFKLAVGDYNEDTVVDMRDYVMFLKDYYEEFADDYRYSLPNFVEVTIAADGSITVIDEDAMEFQLMEAGVHGGQSFDDESLAFDKEYYGVKDTDRLRAMWIPNWWIASGGMMGYYNEGHFVAQRRMYGDNEYPGFMDNKNWKISFNENGTVNFVCSWEDFYDSAALQLVKYGDGKMTIVGLPDFLWDDSSIMTSATAKLSAYLYASEAVFSQPPHTCDFGDWVDDENGTTHTHTCKDPECGKADSEPHGWNDGVQVGTPSCTDGAKTVYTCDDCGATREEDVDSLGHDWGEWTDDGENSPTDTHSRTCQRNCGAVAETENHSWSRWSLVDDNTHEKTCSICHATRTASHDWSEGVVSQEPTEEEEGLQTFTCKDCGHTKGEPIEKLDHNLTFVPAQAPTCTEDGNAAHYFCNGCKRYYSDEDGTTEITAADVTRTKLGHDWGQWTYDSVDSHIRSCKRNCGVEEEFGAHEWDGWKAYDENTHRLNCDICHGYQESEHDWDNGVEITHATCHSVGVMVYTCDTCDHTKTEEIPMTEHTWTDWAPNGDENHQRECMDDNCDALETVPHAWDDGVVTVAPSCSATGVRTYTCQTCSHVKTEELPITDHTWTNWNDNKNGTHTRSCRCNASETKNCNWDAGVVTKEATHLETGIKKFTCTDCNAVREDTIEKTAAHTFGEWTADITVVGKHHRECACGEIESAGCSYDAGVVTTEPTYESTGTKTYTCTGCGGKKTEALDMLVKADELVSPDNSEIKITTPDGSNAILNENTVIQIDESKDKISDEVKTNVIEVVGGKESSILASYDISLLLDGATVQPGGKVEVTLPAPENASDFDTLQVVYIDDEGNVTPCETRVNADGTVTFVTDHFSRYAIIGVQNTSPVVWILISAVSVTLITGAVVAVLIIKKKKGIA